MFLCINLKKKLWKIVELKIGISMSVAWQRLFTLIFLLHMCIFNKISLLDVCQKLVLIFGYCCCFLKAAFSYFFIKIYILCGICLALGSFVDFHFIIGSICVDITYFYSICFLLLLFCWPQPANNNHKPY